MPTVQPSHFLPHAAARQQRTHLQGGILALQVVHSGGCRVPAAIADRRRRLLQLPHLRRQRRHLLLQRFRHSLVLLGSSGGGLQPGHFPIKLFQLSLPLPIHQPQLRLQLRGALAGCIQLRLCLLPPAQRLRQLSLRRRQLRCGASPCLCRSRLGCFKPPTQLFHLLLQLKERGGGRGHASERRAESRPPLQR